MDAELDAIRSVTSKVPLDWVQLHGDEPPAVCAALATDHKIIKAFGVTDAATFEDLAAYVPHVQAFLLDAPRPGSGQTFDWDLIARCPRDRPVFVAGGLNPDNLAEAVRLSGAEVVDVSSGVESAPGRKDPRLIEAFLARAEDA